MLQLLVVLAALYSIDGTQVTEYNKTCYDFAHASCSAQDVELQLISSNVSTCNHGETIPITITVGFHQKAGTRYDFGFWFNVYNGATDAVSSSDRCAATVFNGSEYGFQSFDSDQCGDQGTGSDDDVLLNFTLQVLCHTGPGGRLLIPGCAAWSQNPGVNCDVPSKAIPGTTSKCSCLSNITTDVKVITQSPTRSPTTSSPISASPTTKPTTQSPTTQSPTTQSPTTRSPTTRSPTKSPTKSPTTQSPTTRSPTTNSPTTTSPTTTSPTTRSPTTRSPTTRSPTKSPTTQSPTTRSPTTTSPTTRSPTTKSPTTTSPTGSPTTPPCARRLVQACPLLPTNGTAFTVNFNGDLKPNRTGFPGAFAVRAFRFEQPGDCVQLGNYDWDTTYFGDVLPGCDTNSLPVGCFRGDRYFTLYRSGSSGSFSWEFQFHGWGGSVPANVQVSQPAATGVFDICVSASLGLQISSEGNVLATLNPAMPYFVDMAKRLPSASYVFPFSLITYHTTMPNPPILASPDANCADGEADVGLLRNIGDCVYLDLSRLSTPDVLGIGDFIGSNTASRKDCTQYRNQEAVIFELFDGTTRVTFCPGFPLSPGLYTGPQEGVCIYDSTSTARLGDLKNFSICKTACGVGLNIDAVGCTPTLKIEFGTEGDFQVDALSNDLCQFSAGSGLSSSCLLDESYYTSSPTHAPTPPTTSKPTTPKPTTRPTNAPTPAPTTRAPTTPMPTRAPTPFPTTRSPTTRNPTQSPTTRSPTTRSPTGSPVARPSTGKPTTRAPTTRSPTKMPTKPTTRAPTTKAPSKSPSTRSPTTKPTTRAPTTKAPSKSPSTRSPTKMPTKPTTRAPTIRPVTG